MERKVSYKVAGKNNLQYNFTKGVTFMNKHLLMDLQHTASEENTSNHIDHQRSNESPDQFCKQANKILEDKNKSAMLNVLNKLSEVLNCPVIFGNNVFKDSKGIFTITTNKDGSYTVKEKGSDQVDTYKDAFDLFMNLTRHKFAITYGRVNYFANIDIKQGSQGLKFDVHWSYKRVSLVKTRSNYQMSVEFVTKADMLKYIDNLKIEEEQIYSNKYEDFVAE